MRLHQIGIMVTFSICSSLIMAQDLVVSGTTITTDLAILALDCAGFNNGGALTTDVDGVVICSDDSGTTGPHTVDTTLSEAQVDAFVANNGYSTGAHTVNTNLSEAQVDNFVANNGYSTGAHTVNTNLSEAQVDAFVANNGYSTSRVSTDTSSNTTYFTDNYICIAYANSAVTITAPKAGTIVVEAQAWMIGYHTLGTDNRMYVTIGTNATDCADVFSRAYWTIPSEWPSASAIQQTLNTRRSFSVPAGTYTYYLTGTMESGYVANTDKFWFSNMIATFHD